MKTNWHTKSLMALTPPTGEKAQAHGKYSKMAFKEEAENLPLVDD